MIYFFQGLPLFVDHLELNNILLCRQVCKKWREIIDQFLLHKITDEPFENEAYLKKIKQFPLEQLSKQKYRRIKYAYHFKTYTSVIEFHDKMKYHSELGLSPFVVGANIYFQDTNQNQGEVKRFIEDFGQHIKSLKFEENGPGITQTNAKFRFGKMVQKSLENCPNLQKLALKTKSDRIERLECRLQGALDECFKQNSLGVPKNLISLSMNMHEDYNKKPNLSPILMTKLIKPFYEEQLRKFKVYWTQNLKLKMPHLKDLTLIIRHIVFFNSCDCSGILGAEWLQAPIQKMHLKPDNPCNTQSIDLHKMLEMFPTIQYLKLDYGIWGSVNFTNPVSVWSHNIHTLELTNFIGHGDVPYDFFYAFPKLRYFNMRIS